MDQQRSHFQILQLEIRLFHPSNAGRVEGLHDRPVPDADLFVYLQNSSAAFWDGTSRRG
jgi:hypothetical protein